MALDSDQLLEGLRSYSESIDRETARLEVAYQEMEKTYLSLRQSYKSRKFDEFQKKWARVDAFFKEYLQGTRRVSEFVKDRSKSLQRFND